MSERLSGAIEELELQLQDQLLEVANTKKLINSLLKRMGQEPRYEDVNVEHRGAMRADEYYGKPLSTAIQMVLDRRHQAMSADDILKVLDSGGFDFRPLKWSDNARMRNLVISMVKNSKTFHRLPNGSFGLTSWYDQATINASKKEREGKAAEDAPDVAEPGEDEIAAE